MGGSSSTAKTTTETKEDTKSGSRWLPAPPAYKCDECGSDIPDEGTRYACISCVRIAHGKKMAKMGHTEPISYDVCQACFTKSNDTIHKGHEIRRCCPSFVDQEVTSDRIAISMKNALERYSTCPVIEDSGKRITFFFEIYERARALATYLLLSLHLQKGDCIALVMENCSEWIIVDVACMFSGIVSVPISHTLPSDTIGFIIQRVEPKVIFDTANTHDTVSKVVADLGLQSKVYCITKKGNTTHSVTEGNPENMEKDLLSTFNHFATPDSWAPVKPGNPNDMLTIIFTSGSTGLPKGTIFSDAMFNGEAPELFPGVLFCYEPLSYSTQRMLVQRAIRAGTQISIFSGHMETFLDELKLAAPTSFSAPPRIWNLFYAIYKNRVSDLSKKEAYLEGERAKNAGQVWTQEAADASWGSYVTKDVIQYLGPRIFSISTGGAPTSPEVMNWLKRGHSMLSEGYGATEVGGIGSNGVRKSDCQVHLDDVPELGYFSTDKPYSRGLLWVRTSRMTTGYYGDPMATNDNFKIRSDIDGQKWYNTGDIVEYSPGTEHLRVIDRVKNIIKLAQAVFVAPERLENIFIESKFVENIFIYAESLFEYVTAVVVPNLPYIESVASSCQFDSTDLNNPVLIQKILSNFVEVGQAHHLQPYEIPQKILIDPNRWSPENHLLTPSFKLDRLALRSHYQSKLRALYGITTNPGTASSVETHSSRASEATPSPAFDCNYQKMVDILESVSKKSLNDIKDCKIQSLGFDSMSVVHLSLIVKQILPTPVSLATLFQSTVQQLCDFVQARKENVTEGIVLPSPVATDWKQEMTLPAHITSSLRSRHFDRQIPTSRQDGFQIFLTGVTGFLGIHILVDLLSVSSVKRIFCLVRASTELQATERLHATLEYFGFPLLPLEKVVIVLGYLDKPLFSLSEAQFSSLASEVDIVIHNGCHVNGIYPYQALKDSNVGGTIESLNLATSKRCSRFCYVSTISVFGSLFMSDDPVDESRSFALSSMAGYSASKLVSEYLVNQAYAAGLPVTIVRPGMITGSHLYGVCNPNDFITKYLETLVQLRTVPIIPPEVKFAMVAVNYVARLITIASLLTPYNQLQLVCGNPDILPVFHAHSLEAESIPVMHLSKALPEAGIIDAALLPYPKWLEILFSQSDPNLCSLVPLKSYFRNGFPAESTFCTPNDHAHSLLQQLPSLCQKGYLDSSLRERIELAPNPTTLVLYLKATQLHMKQKKL
ncbi:AMP-binding protein [Pelomyxa schiedti]|nr:AMP-binding protein [Pelomyxa schiedti]